MWLLHAGNVDVVLRAVAEKPSAHRRRNTVGDFRQSLPLYRVSKYCKGRAIRLQKNGAGRDKIMETQKTNPGLVDLEKTSPEISGMGHKMKRKEDSRFIQGRGNYVDDVNLPHMVYGHMVRSPYAHARIKSINTEAAKKLPGVL